MLKAIGRHPHGKLEFTTHKDNSANLSGIDFSPAALKKLLRKYPNNSFLKTGRANLTDANLQHATLTGANFEEAGLMAAEFNSAYLSAANFHKAGMPLAQFSSAYLRGANFTEAYLAEANLKDANLEEADFRGAFLGGVNFQNAFLLRSDLREAKLGYHVESVTNLHGANLQEANLEFNDISNCILDNIYVSGAKLNHTLIKKEQLGGMIGEEIDRDYSKAANGYFKLRKNFETLGDHDAARWAYIKERTMTKRWHGHQSINHFKDKRILQSKKEFFHWLSDWIVELVCEYGESITRVLWTILLLIFIIGPSAISLSGRLIWPHERLLIYNSIDASWGKFWYGYFQTLLYSLDAITTSSLSDLQPANHLVLIVTYTISMIGVFLVGLLGFVTGNRIRH